MFPDFSNKALLLLASLSLFSCNKNPSSMNVSQEKIECKEIPSTQVRVGEGPIWDYKNHRLLWIDTQGALLIYNPQTGENTEYKLDRQIGTVIPYEKDTVLVGLEDGIYEMNLTDNKLHFVADPEGREAGNRYNDGKCDTKGRLWIGTMDKDCTPQKAAFFSVNPGGKFKKELDNVTISNGVTWSPDGKTMYYQDTPTRKVSAFDFDEESGTISNRREVITLPNNLGTPDGNAMDEEGMLWIANWGAACVTRWNPQTGEMLQKIDVPALNVSALAFGGEGMEQLYITTSALWMPDSEVANYPDAGKLFVVTPGVKGAKCNYWKGNK